MSCEKNVLKKYGGKNMNLQKIGIALLALLLAAMAMVPMVSAAEGRPGFFVAGSR
ncbi:MAG: hypothetical protein WCX22_06125 [Methanoregula sp.]